jgi:calcium-dependent protein kinase
LASAVKISASNFIKVQMGELSSDYIVHEPIGQDGFTVVNRCTYVPTGQTRAVKTVFKSGLSYEETDPKYLLKEAKVLRELDHPNILRCYELYQDRSRYYIVMEMCSGGQLFDALSHRRILTEAQAAKVMYQLLSCVAYCHDRKVIHRDLKPENILLEDNDGQLNIKVADFGSSAFIDPLGKLTGCFGSAYYIAPEVAEGQAYNEKCDLWSCGIILFIMLTGRPPYSGQNERQILDNVRRRPFDPLNYKFEGVSQEAVALIVELLRFNIRDRISAAKAVNHPWIQTFRSAIDSEELTSAIGTLRSFNANSKLKDAVYTFLATNVITKDELSTLKQAFQCIDINSDGRLSREELMKVYSQTTHEQQAQDEVESILEEVDSDQSGFIDYSEFVRACMDQAKVLSKSSLELAFRTFDVDGSGMISGAELKEVLSGGERFQEEVWKEIIAEVDLNGDGMIDLKEFTQLMLTKI